ncbi:MAG: hypothetical protein K2X99_04230 [Gemmatimonadaceae bacterium]|nr:hypothetical protein [Gemmatimonadaceae bacterium]
MAPTVAMILMIITSACACHRSGDGAIGILPAGTPGRVDERGHPPS